MRNLTIDFFLAGLSELPALRLPLFLFFLLIYLLTLVWNLLIIVLIVTDSHLHVPMYFFLGNLAGLDLCCSSVTGPRMLFDLHTQTRNITIMACITQVFCFISFASSEIFLLAVMSYDRYTAICHPLHYTQIMNWKLCVQLASIVWCLGFAYSLVLTLCAQRLSFCGSHIIESFFCDLPQLFQISCSDIYINILLTFLLNLSFLEGTSFIITFLSYVYIFKTILKITLKDGRRKAYSTCSSHLTVLFIFYGTGFFNYFQLKTKDVLPKTKDSLAGRLISLFYAVFTPLLNPLIYSLRNRDLKGALQKILFRMRSMT
ncbi:unnamed protein product [Staurois parvus]|uniref:Olfactory receptor n=1 Tax=Staurois parvus TaxID=386267 RepID=A0ABN9GKY3_9NEOB|nr:unnamed protein product [Staurois parvus]